MKPHIGMPEWEKRERIGVYNTNLCDEGFYSPGHGRYPWTVARGGQFLGDFSTHAKAIAYADKLARTVHP